MTNSIADTTTNTQATLSKRMNLDLIANKMLNKAAQFWFLTAVIGQWIFGYYVLFFYGASAAEGNFEMWNKSMPHGYVAGDTTGNFAVAVHLFLAIIIMVGGPLQFIPKIRAKLPTFHRWNGRLYMLTVVMTSVIGLYMIWNRGTVGGVPQYIGISIDAVLIVLFAGFALHSAIIRDFKKHRRWALRLFMVANAVWFYRVAFMLWMTLTGGVGIDMKTFQGSFLTFIAFAQFLLPLTILELYLHSQGKTSALTKLSAAISIFILTIAMDIGIFAATMGMWLPRL